MKNATLSSRWLMPLFTLALGGVILVAEATDGDLAGGLGWFAVLAAVAALLAFGGRFQAVRDARGDSEDERDVLINSRAMAAAGSAVDVLRRYTGATQSTCRRVSALTFNPIRAQRPRRAAGPCVAGRAGSALNGLTTVQYGRNAAAEREQAPLAQDPGLPDARGYERPRRLVYVRAEPGPRNWSSSDVSGGPARPWRPAGRAGNDRSVTSTCLIGSSRGVTARSARHVASTARRSRSRGPRRRRSPQGRRR
jgi:hypothetical protein